MTHSLKNILKVVTSKQTSAWVQSQMIRAVAYSAYKDHRFNITNKQGTGFEDLTGELAAYPKEAFDNPTTKTLDMIDKAERAEAQSAEFLAVYHAAQDDYEVHSDGFKFFHPDDPADPKVAKAQANKASVADRMAALGIKAA